MRFRNLPRSSQALVFINAAAAVITAASVSPYWIDIPWQHLAFAVLLSVALFHITVHPMDGKGQVSFGFAPVLGAAILWGPANGALVGFLAGLLSTSGPDRARRYRGQERSGLRGVRVLYNGCTGCLAGAAAGAVCHIGMAVPLPDAGRMCLLGISGLLAFFVVNTWFMAGILATTKGRNVLGFWRTEMFPTLPQYAIGGAGAILFLHLIQTGGWGGMALIALGPMYAMQECYRRGSENLGQRRRQIAALRGVNASLFASMASMGSAAASRSGDRPRRSWSGRWTECSGATSSASDSGPSGERGTAPPAVDRIAGRRLSLALRNPTDLKDMAEALAREAMQMAPGTTAVVALTQGDGALRVAAATGLYGDRLRGMCMPGGTTTWDQALKQGRAILNLPPDAAILDAVPCDQPPGLRSALVVPLIHEREKLGVICVYHARGGAYTERHAERLGLVTEIITPSLATAIQRDAAGRLTDADPLAGLSEDVSVIQALEASVERARAKRVPFAAVLLDLGDIQTAHEELGPAAGVDPLMAAESVIPSCVRPTDSVARLAGSRFIVLLNDTSLNSCIHVCARIVTALDRMAERGGLSVGTSGGFGLYPDDGTTVRALIEAAEHRLARDRATRKPQL